MKSAAKNQTQAKSAVATNTKQPADQKQAQQVEQSTTVPSYGFDMAQLPMLPPNQGQIQTKLRINAPNDRYEQEADRIADQVMRMKKVDGVQTDSPSSRIQQKPLVQQISRLPLQAQRKCNNCGTCRKCQEEERIQRKAVGQTPNIASPSLSSRIQSTRGNGRTMDASTNAFMSSRFGTDFSEVRIHTGAAAQQMSQEINARAFTVGQDMYFNQGEYQPNTASGQRLLAHELVHTVQQGEEVKIQRRTFDDDILKYPPKKFADHYFKGNTDYSWNKLTRLFHTGGIASENIKLKNFLIRNDLTWSELVSKFEGNGGLDYIHILEFDSSVFINAPTIGLAYSILQNPDFEFKYPPDVGWSFYYTDGLTKPSRIEYSFDYKPSEKQRNLIHQDIGNIEYPKRRDIPEEEKIKGVGVLYDQVNKELENEIQDLASKAWKNYGGEVLELYHDIKDLQELYCNKHKIPTKNTSSGESKYELVETCIWLGAKKIIKDRIIAEGKPNLDDYAWEDADLNMFRKRHEMFAYQAEKRLNSEYEILMEQYVDKYENDVKKEYQPYIDLFEEKRLLVIEKLESRLENVTDRKTIGEWNKAAEQELQARFNEIMKEANIAFQTTEIKIKIDQEIRDELLPLEKELMNPNIITYIEKLNDPELLKIVQKWDSKLVESKPIKGKEGFYHKARAEFITVDQKTEALRSAYWDEIRPYMERHEYDIDTINNVYDIFYYQYSKSFLFTDAGEATPYALRKWAKERLVLLNSSIANISTVLEMHRPYFDGSHVYNDALRDLNFELGFTKEFLNTIISHPEKSEGALKDLNKGAQSLQWYESIPFIGSLFNYYKNKKLKRVTKKLDVGVPIAKTELELLESWSALQDLTSIQPTPFWYNVGKNAAHTLVFMAEFAILSPFGGFGVKLGEAAAVKVLQKLGNKIHKRLIIKGTGKLFGSFFITVANPLKVIVEAEKMGLPMTSVQFHADGSISLFLSANDNAGNPMNLLRAFASVYASNLTEMVGGQLVKGIGKGIGRLMPTKITNSVFSKSIFKVKKLFKNYNYNGPLGEYEEEIYDNILQALLRGEAPKFKEEEQLEIFATVVLIGGGAKGIQLTVAGFQYVNTFNINGKEVTLSPKVIDLLANLVNVQSKEHFDSQMTEWLNLGQVSKEEHSLAKKLAEKVSFHKKEIEATKENLKEQLINGSNVNLKAEYESYQSLYLELELIKEKYQQGIADEKYHFNPTDQYLELDFTISSEMELDIWMNELGEAIMFIQGVAEFKNLNLNRVELKGDTEIKSSNALNASDESIIKFATEKGLTDVQKINGIWYVTNSKGNTVHEFDIDYYGEFSKKGKGTDHFYEAHHGLQDKFGYFIMEKFCTEFGLTNPYKSKKCPAILLRDSFRDSPHGITKTLQSNRNIDSQNTYEEMLEFMKEDLDAASVPQEYQINLLNQSNKYFGELYFNLKEQLIIQKRSNVESDIILKKLFGKFKPTSINGNN